MGAANELGAYQGCFRFKNFRINQIQGIATHIAIAIAGGGLKIIIADHIIAEGGNNLFRIHQSCSFQLRSVLGHLGQGICFYCLIIYFCQIIHLTYLFFEIFFEFSHLLGLHAHLKQSALGQVFLLQHCTSGVQAGYSGRIAIGDEEAFLHCLQL